MTVQKRNTIQRQLVISAVRSLSNHPTAEEVYNRIVLDYPDISKGTVYRNLNSLVVAARFRTQFRRPLRPYADQALSCAVHEMSPVHECGRPGLFPGSGRQNRTDDRLSHGKS